MRERLAAALLPLPLLLAAGGAAKPVEDPCMGPQARQLLCPNLKMAKPSELLIDSHAGHLVLRATSDVESRGLGPMELRGTRNGWRTMRTRQRIYRRGGGHIEVPSRGTLRFTDVGYAYGGAYWKVHQLARFELRRVRPGKPPGPVIRTSPKLNYCLRDLERTRPGRRSPPTRHYPGCNQNPYRAEVTLGTSVGWSDIYPATYDKQWIDVGGLSGCFVFTMTVDPRNLLYESNEHDNASHVRVRLPYPGYRGC